MKWITPEWVMWASGPPSASAVTVSPVTCLMTCGPVMNICALRVWMMKSVSAGTVGGAAGAGAADQRDLRHRPGEHDVGVEDAAVAGQRVDALLHARAAGVVDEDERAAGLQRQLHHVGDLLAVDLAGRRRRATVKSWLARWISRPSTEARPVTTPSAGISLPAMPKLVARCWANRPISSKLSAIDQRLDALARRQLARCVLLGEALRAAALLEVLALLAQLLHAISSLSFCSRLSVFPPMLPFHLPVRLPRRNF